MINLNFFGHTYNVNYYHNHCSNQRIVIIFFFILFFNGIVYIFNRSKKITVIIKLIMTTNSKPCICFRFKIYSKFLSIKTLKLNVNRYKLVHPMYVFA